MLSHSSNCKTQCHKMVWSNNGFKKQSDKSMVREFTRGYPLQQNEYSKIPLPQMGGGWASISGLSLLVLFPCPKHPLLITTVGSKLDALLTQTRPNCCCVSNLVMLLQVCSSTAMLQLQWHSGGGTAAAGRESCSQPVRLKPHWCELTPNRLPCSSQEREKKTPCPVCSHAMVCS